MPVCVQREDESMQQDPIASVPAGRIRPFPACVGMLLAALLSAAYSQGVTPAPGQTFTSASDDGAWTFFTDPRGILQGQA
jgi:hypothetical protein